MRRELTLTSIVILILSCLSIAITSSALAAKKRVIIGYTSPPGKQEEDDIIVKGGKVKHRYNIIPAIAAEIDEAEVDKIKKKPKVKYVEPDYEVHIAGTIPNDLNSNLWGLNNTGQTGGTPDADIDAPEAWDMQTGSSDVVIAVIDTGVDYNHVDLAANMWTNPGEIPGNGVDDDGNGYVDDVHGYDFYNYDSDPMDDHSHGTHCAGTIAAVGDNGVGVVGVNWTAGIMALKFLNADGAGFSSDAVACVEYVTMMNQEFGMPVIATSNSWGGGGYSVSLESALATANSAGILFVAAAGNAGRDNDVTPFYPASYSVPNVISVAATDSNDDLAGFSNYGAASVDLAAPGMDILSTIPGHIYGYKTGTSMATPHVSGVVALIKAELPSITHTSIKERILDSVDPKAGLAGKMVTGGRLNVRNALGGLPEPPAPPTGLVATTGSLLVNLDWNDNSEPALTGYRVYRGVASGEPYDLIATPDASQYTDADVDGVTTYYYVVTAVCDFDIESEYSNETSVTTPPAAPTGLVAMSGDQQVTLDWDDNTGAVEYNVYRSTISGGGYSPVATALPVSECTDMNVFNGTTYYYVVTAVGLFTGEEGEPSNEVSATPAEATSKILHVINTNIVRYSDDFYLRLGSGKSFDFQFESFSIPEGKALTSVVIYVEHREDDAFNGNLEWIVKDVSKADVPLHIAKATDSWDVTDIVDDSDLLNLWLTIHNNSQQGNTDTDYIYARVEWIVPDNIPPAKVTGLAVATESSSSLNLTWDANTEPDLSHYNVYRSSTSGGPYSLIASPATNSYLDTGLEPSTTYYYVVSAEDTMEAEGPMSDEASGTTAASENTPPAKVTGLEVTTSSSSSLMLTWNANSEPDLSHYNVYKSNTSGGPYSLISSPTTNSYLDTGLEPSTTYYYVVSAEDTLEAEGPMSDEASGTTSMPVDTIMYVESITFSSKVAGKNKFLYIDVKVVDGNAKPLSGAEVDMLLVRDGGGPWYFSDDTEYNGIVRFTQRKADVGGYTATVTDLSLSGRKWDSNKGITSDSCELQSDGTVIQGTALTPALASSMLLQNNPNPFNPETWIPYVLAEPERVTIRIYDTTGRLVKTLDLGDKAAGAYISKEKSAYWDGTNENGENVSSGVYFYTMEAGSFSAVERMVIIR